MAAELSIIELIGKVPGCPIRFIVADATAVPKGSLMRATDARNVVVHTGADQPIIGVAAEEHVASVGDLSMSVYTNGIFDMTAAAAGAAGVGSIVAGSGTQNMFTPADGNDMKQGSFVGQALEAADNDERIAVRILK